MWVFKSCARCGGDVYVNQEPEATCMQCGHILRSQEFAPLAAMHRTRRRPRVPAPLQR